jgi:hypothetical protein
LAQIAYEEGEKKLAIHYLEMAIPHTDEKNAESLRIRIEDLKGQILKEAENAHRQWNEKELWIFEREQEIRTMTYYELFGLQPTFSPVDLKKAHTQMIKTFHPDRFYGEIGDGAKKKLEEIVTKITKAYRVLTDRRLRIKYHTFLKKHGRLPSGVVSEPPLHEH